MADGKKSYIVDAGVNLLYTTFWYNFDISLDKRYEGLNEPSQVNGPLCMNIDILAENIMLPPLERGTIMTLWPAGAYSVTQAMQFIRYKPKNVLIDKEGGVHLIKDSDDLEYVVEKESVPEYLLKG
jgi:diaminopimelate decarboxylase